MTTVLSTRQGLLTRAVNRLTTNLEEDESLTRTLLKSIHEEEGGTIETRTLLQKLRLAKATLEVQVSQVDKALEQYSGAADHLDSNTPSITEILQKVNSNVETAAGHLDRARTVLTTMARLHEELRHIEEHGNRTLPSGSPDAPTMNLAPIPIPKFSGRLWEWDTFWGAFEHSVHSRQIDDLFKMNYLLDALQGEARETVKQFEVSRTTYPLVVEHLKRKYGDTQALVDLMIRRLQGLQAKSERLEDQEKLAENLWSIVSQLQLKGENINNIFLQKQLLGKFTEEIQRYVLRKQELDSSNTSWDTNTLLTCVKEYIATELKIVHRIDKKGHHQETQHTAKERRESRKEQLLTSGAGLCFPCFYCGSTDHKPKDCDKARTREERIAIIKKRKLCHNCGSHEHMANQCKRGACRKCKQPGHHTSVCPQLASSSTSQKPFPGPDNKATSQAQAKTPSKRIIPKTTSKMNTVVSEKGPAEEEIPDAAVYVSHHRNIANVHILVGQAQVLNPESQALEVVHVMLDTGADRSFVCSKLAERLQLPDISTVELTINTFGSQQPLKKTCGVTELQMWDAHGAAHKMTVTKIDTLTEPITRSSLSEEDKRFLFDKNMRLSINSDITDIRPQVLLGCADLYSLLDRGLGVQATLPSGLRLISSKLGYLVSGRDNSQDDESYEVPHTVAELETTSAESDDKPQSWEDFCTFESTGVHEFTGPSAEERRSVEAEVWETFKRTIERKEDGYYVRLPWKAEAATLPDNKSIAVRRLGNTLAKLTNDVATLQQYHETIMYQCEQGIIEEIDENAPNDGPIVHYLAHRAVLTPHKETTKLRVVFDASAHLKGHPSLNDVLHQGPVILPRIWDILMRFRIGEVAITSDVEKAFLQVRVHPQDRDATRFLWLRDITQSMEPANIVTYRFTRVTFGLNCSPFLLAGTIKHHLDTYVENPQLAKEISDNTYVDNVIVTSSSTDEALRLCVDSKLLFRDLNMNLREFRSNDRELNARIPPEDLSSKVLQKVLGLQWNSQEDRFVITCQYPAKMKLTKRSVSEQIASVYDPLGLLTPLTLRGKQFLQQLWKFEYDWDTILSEEHQQIWNEVVEETSGFQTTIPRKIAQISAPATLVLFADASGNGMAACAYLVSETTSHLLVGKSKLPSLKDNPTIPKLELNALTMAVRLALSIDNAIGHRVKIERLLILSDSRIALSWLKAPVIEKSAGVLVKNRIVEIRRIIAEIREPVRFGYVNTFDNPADCGTRGLKKTELDNHMWWRGPDFIKNPIERWPKESCLFTLPKDDAEENTCAVATVTEAVTPTELLDWQRHNRLASAKRTLAYALRFVHQLSLKVNTDLRTRIEKNIPELQYMTTEPYITATENSMALQVLIRHHQATHFTSAQLKSLKQLNVQRDEHGILRCRGRLGKAQIDFDAKHPMLIAPKTDLAKAIVNDAHLPQHCSAGQTIANARQQFWIPKVRQLAKKVLRMCVPCQKLNNLPFKYPEMDDLPERRVKRTRPFEHVGIDYFGPLWAKEHDSTFKVYGVIITCTATRLLHLELVMDMSTTQLLHALRRFFARRGVPASITSDNGPSFLLGEQILRDAVLPVINDVSLATTMATKGIIWKTITPYAPWQGAFYERLIKSVKHSLYKVMQRAVVSAEELETLLIEVEGTLNCRPLTYQEERWEDHPVLRPIDFIQRDMILTFPFESLEGNEGENYLPSSEALEIRSRKQAEEALKSSHQLTERFWIIWEQQYLSSLRESHKLSIDSKRSSTTVPAVDQVVLISDPVIPRNSWKLGRIVRLFCSDNGKIREAQLRLPNGRLIRRPVNLLIPLELNEEPEQANGQVKKDDTDELQNDKTVTSRYDLRPRNKVNYNEQKHTAMNNVFTPASNVPLGYLLTLLATLAILPTTGSAVAMIVGGQMRCTQGGVSVFTHNIERFELCVEGSCHVKEHPLENETIYFPPEVLLHEHEVQLKLFDGENITVLETSCLAAPFCEHVRCWLCTANMFNPECAPRMAITAFAVMTYIIVALLYVFCYVPLIIGKPFRIIGNVLWKICRSIGHVLWKLCFNRHWQRYRRRRYDVEALLRAPLLTILCLSTFPSSSLACQDIDVFSHRNSICTYSPSGSKRCSLETTEVMKLNTFHRDACIRLLNNQSVQKELRIQWKGLRLTCVKEDVVFTRNTVQRVLDSKRCSHSGSCTRDKCAFVNTTSLIPELDEANQYPGITRCVESCGGPGCGCFYLSSGCLFYRIFHLPIDKKIYEIFKCNHWTEEVQLEITTISRSEKGVKKRIISAKPTIPVNVEGTRITLSALSAPPTPALSSSFISDGTQLAIWSHSTIPPLLCESEDDARLLNCTVTTTCDCIPAESKVNCICPDFNITKVFTEEIENRFPIRRPWITFTAGKDDITSVVAQIPSFTTAEFIVRLREKFDKTVTMVSDAICTIPNSVATGCYHCSQGATAEVRCTSNEDYTMATVHCDDKIFTIPCQRDGTVTTLRFNHNAARMRKECKVSCGQTQTRFEITGILQWVRTIHGSSMKIISGGSTVYDELVFPDFGHIIDVILNWYKSTVLVCVIFIIALATGYLMFWTCGIHVILRALRLQIRIMGGVLRIILWLPRRALQKVMALFRAPHKGSEKLL